MTKFYLHKHEFVQAVLNAEHKHLSQVRNLFDIYIHKGRSDYITLHIYEAWDTLLRSCSESKTHISLYELQNCLLTDDIEIDTIKDVFDKINTSSKKIGITEFENFMLHLKHKHFKSIMDCFDYKSEAEPDPEPELELELEPDLEPEPEPELELEPDSEPEHDSENDFDEVVLDDIVIINDDVDNDISLFKKISNFFLGIFK